MTQEKRKIKKLESRSKNARWNDLRDGYNAAYAGFLGEYNSAMDHYRIKKQYVLRNYIFSQYQYSWYKNIKMGRAGNLQDNGCGIIAIYNFVILISNQYQTLEEHI